MYAEVACSDAVRAVELPALAVDGLSVLRTRDAAPIVRDVSLEVKRGEILGVVGESGSGKTTLALALLGFAAPGLALCAARIGFGERILDLASENSIRAARRHAISYVPQDPTASLNPALSIKTQLYERFDKAHLAQAEAAIADTLRSVDLPHDKAFLKRRVGTLSGGQQQRVAIAMAAVTQPGVLVLDEPTTGLDVTTQAAVLSLVRRLCHETGMAGVFISHDLAVIRHVADHIMVLYAGYDVEYGPADLITARPSHPYTAALLQCVPATTHAADLEGIPGRPPAPEQPERGCPFAPRCSYVTDACTAAVPARHPTASIGMVRCIHPLNAERCDPQTLEHAQDPTTSTRHTVTPHTVLDIHGLDAWYGQTQVLFDIAIRAAAGECVAIVGQSGSGKTTLTRCMIGLHPTYTGTIAFDDKAVASKASRRTLDERRRIQCVFQNPFGSLNPRRSVGATISAPLSLYFGFSHRQAATRVAELLERVGLPASMAESFPSELSGGQQQRIAIARSLAADPDVLICDEITSALDVSVQASLLGLLKELLASGLAMVFITHNLGVVRNIADQVDVLQGGRIVEAGATASVIDHPRNAYTRSLLKDTLSVTDGTSA